MNNFILILFTIGLVLVIISWIRADLKCPVPKIIYRYVPKHTLDVQFSNTDNNPSQIYSDIFNKSSPWIGGYALGEGKTIPTESNQSS
jgi:hypothetical protein